VAAASCFPGPIDAIAALAPGKGAAATQANFDLDNRNRVFELLQAGQAADDIITAMTASVVDPDAGQRQYGVVTLEGDTVTVAGFTGTDNLAWAGDRQDATAAVTVQGNILEGEAAVAAALDAFRAGDAPLADRLMRALEAGSAAGGDRRCNQGGARQTASAAFIMAARAGDPAYAVPALGRSDAESGSTPWLYLSVVEPIGDENPLRELRQRYDAWRADNLPAGVTPSPEIPTVASTFLLPVLAAVLFLGLLLLLLAKR
jgi:uncharacterized Ntn-hydrolase superfamily protein